MESNTKVLVLNQDYQAIGVCTVQRAFVLVYLRKAEMLTEISGACLRSVNSTFAFPSIIRLHRYISIPYKKVNLTRQNIFKRDNNRCVYCGSRDDLTIDHVIPRSTGGKDRWDNLVTACQKCNSKKGNMTPEQAEMDMRHRPFRPSFVMYLSNFSGHVQDDWKPYLYMA